MISSLIDNYKENKDRFLDDMTQIPVNTDPRFQDIQDEIDNSDIFKIPVNSDPRFKRLLDLFNQNEPIVIPISVKNE